MERVAQLVGQQTVVRLVAREKMDQREPGELRLRLHEGQSIDTGQLQVGPRRSDQLAGRPRRDTHRELLLPRVEFAHPLVVGLAHPFRHGVVDHLVTHIRRAAVDDAHHLRDGDGQWAVIHPNHRVVGIHTDLCATVGPREREAAVFVGHHRGPKMLDPDPRQGPGDQRQRASRTGSSFQPSQTGIDRRRCRRRSQHRDGAEDQCGDRDLLLHDRLSLIQNPGVATSHEHPRKGENAPLIEAREGPERLRQRGNDLGVLVEGCGARVVAWSSRA